ncbi:MAG: hypothetical protein JWL69_4814 [Phycisphaerales bacterium]|nr:hypothetical protein [Phycisphaerales bacterium]MDB5357014.1 hypothetical protein [Phycisphaerales bacterium]
MNAWSIDQDLGYFGHDRFVLFYYEPRAHEVMWRDSRSSGSGCNGWPPPIATLAAEARARGITLGTDTEHGDHVLLVDRVDHQACFAYREEAQEFLARRGEVREAD